MNSLNKPGNSFYYSYRLLDNDNRAILAALFDLQDALSSLAHIKAEKNIAYTKLHWWSEEIERLAQGEPRHPLTKTLHGTTFATNNSSLLKNLLGAAKMNLDYDSYPDYLTLCQYLDLSSGSLIDGASLLSGSVQTKPFSTYLGRAISMTRYLQQLSQDLQRGMLYIPLSDLSQHNVSAEELRVQANPEQSSVLCEHYAVRINENFSKAYECLSPDELEQQLPNLVYGKLHQSLLAKMHKNNYDVFAQNIQLAPLKKLFISMLANPAKIVRQ